VMNGWRDFVLRGCSSRDEVDGPT